ncbi:MAG: hypothetical protein ABUK17_06470 [Syntrophobacteria bacterium]|jgi:hypothetical protein
MNGSTRLSDQEKREMREDAHDVERAKVFRAARVNSQRGSLDAYINFLSENMELFDFVPTRRNTANYKL